MYKVSSFPVEYVEKLYMIPVSFKEFLWANKFIDEMIEDFKKYYD